MCVVSTSTVGLVHPSASTWEWFEAWHGPTLAAAPGLNVYGSQAVPWERLRPTGMVCAQESGHSLYRRHMGIQIRQMMEYFYSSDLAKLVGKYATK